jgi:hypothetical protein
VFDRRLGCIAWFVTVSLYPSPSLRVEIRVIDSLKLAILEGGLKPLDDVIVCAFYTSDVVECEVVKPPCVESIWFTIWAPIKINRQLTDLQFDPIAMSVDGYSIKFLEFLYSVIATLVYPVRPRFWRGNLKRFSNCCDANILGIAKTSD